MIYFIFSKPQMARYNLPKYGISDKSHDFIQMRLKYMADSIFKYENNSTVYFKDRGTNNKQYSSEDILAIRLQAVLL